MKKAMILAAGLGTRLRPFSEMRPKPLFPVLGQPLLLHILAQLRSAGFGSVVVNAHHLREQIVAALAGEPDVLLQEEIEVLGTGGGLRRALDRFGAEPVLVTNGDIFHTIDYDRVYQDHCDSGAAVTLVLHDEPRFNKVAVAADGAITGFGGEQLVAPGARRLAFTGIHVIDPAVLKLIPADTFYDIIDCYRALIRSGTAVRALVVRDHFWTDMGTPADYLALHGALLAGMAAGGGEGGTAPFHVDPLARLGNGVELRDWVAIGAGASIGDRASLSRVVVWDGARVPAGSTLNDTIVT